MEDYEVFRDRMDDLNKFIDSCETKEIDDKVHITIDDDNVDEFMSVINNLITIASSDDGYVDDILEYLNELNQKLTDKNMIAKFIPLFAAMNCFAKMTTLPVPTKDVKVDDWVFELHDLDEGISVPPLDARFGRVVNIIEEEEGTGVIYKVRAPLSNETVEWEDATFIVIPDMDAMLKKYQEKYTKTF